MINQFDLVTFASIGPSFSASRLDANLQVKVADFGLSRDLGDEENNTAEEQEDTASKPLPIRWMSPEAISSRKFTLKSDVVLHGFGLF